MVRTLEPLTEELSALEIDKQEGTMTYQIEQSDSGCFSYSGCYSVSGCISCYSVD